MRREEDSNILIGGVIGDAIDFDGVEMNGVKMETCC